MRLFYAKSEKNPDVYRLLALAVERVYAVPCPVVAKDKYGKPFFPTRPDIHFSLSHTRGMVLAMLDSAPCGCDVERPREVSQRVMSRVCAPGELSDFDFIELWTLKESCYKLMGHTDKPFADLTFRRLGDKILTPCPDARALTFTVDTFHISALSLTPPPDSIDQIILPT